MIKKIVPIVLQGVLVFGGVAGGIYVKSSGMLGGDASASAEAAHGDEGVEGADADENDGGHGEKDAHGKSKSDAKKDKMAEKGGGHGEEAKEGGDRSGGVIRFSRQFVVPVIDAGGANSLIVLDIGIETPPGSEGLYSYELKLRDALLAALLKLSNEGAFDGDFLETGNLDGLRAALLVAAQGVISEDAKQILILNIARQEV